jgi:hypothetical protein
MNSKILCGNSAIFRFLCGSVGMVTQMLLGIGELTH